MKLIKKITVRIHFIFAGNISMEKSIAKTKDLLRYLMMIDFEKVGKNKNLL